jgi:hypothetical protein
MRDVKEAFGDDFNPKDWANNFVKAYAIRPEIAKDITTLKRWFTGVYMAGYERGMNKQKEIEEAARKAYEPSLEDVMEELAEINLDGEL